MPDTGIVLKDALTSMKAHLETQKAAWGVKTVDSYPSYLSGRSGPCIALEISGARCRLAAVSYPTLMVDYEVTIKITYFSNLFRADTYYIDVVTMLDKIIKFLLTDSTPDNYGELLATGADFGPAIGELPATAGAPLFGGSLEVTLLSTRTITQT